MINPPCAAVARTDLRLLVYPVVVGKGKRLFREDLATTWKLVEARSFSSGVVALIYEPARK